MALSRGPIFLIGSGAPTLEKVDQECESEDHDDEDGVGDLQEQLQFLVDEGKWGEVVTDEAHDNQKRRNECLV